MSLRLNSSAIMHQRKMHAPFTAVGALSGVFIYGRNAARSPISGSLPQALLDFASDARANKRSHNSCHVSVEFDQVVASYYHCPCSTKQLPGRIRMAAN